MVRSLLAVVTMGLLGLLVLLGTMVIAPPQVGAVMLATATATVISPQAGDVDPDDIDLTLPERDSFDPETVSDIALTDYPVMPVVTEHARRIYAQGLEQGNNPGIFSKIGDCMTAAEPFLTPFGLDGYDLGEYSDLDEVVAWFGAQPARQAEDFELDAFANPGLSTASGFNAASVLDALWANPQWCEPNESPLDCEYRNSQPSLAIIMFGTNDVYYLEADAFNFYLRSVVLQTIESNIVPVLNTFPIRPEFPEKSLLYNQIIIRVALDYDLPLINLWLALEDLPNHGVDTVETIHLTVPEDGDTGILDAEHLQAGYTMRNLVTLQALDVLWRGLDESAAEAE